MRVPRARSDGTAAGIVRAAVLATALVGALALLAGCGSGSGYEVRAIFDNAGNVIPGEDVKIAGVKVGRVGSLDVTPDQKAAVVLDVATPGFQDFRRDATCTVRPQSLIGEKFVDCTPTQSRPVGAPASPPLPVIPHGLPGAGQRLLPVTQTSSPVDLDLVGDILRLPYRQRLTLLVNELGTGLAGQGDNLRAVIRRADPALAQTDQVLAILAAENRTLAKLAADSDAAVAPLARNRAQVADWVTQASTTATATATENAAVDRSLAQLPTFLRELTPTLDQLGQLADATTPVLSDLAAGAPQINAATAHLAPFAQAATPYLHSLGSTAAAGIAPVQAAVPVTRSLAALGTEAQPFAANTSSLLSSVRSTGGLEQILNFIFLGAAATNGYDSLGHYLRAALVVNPCSTYATTPSEGCSANFVPSSPAPSTGTSKKRKNSASVAAASPSSPVRNALLGYLLGR